MLLNKKRCLDWFQIKRCIDWFQIKRLISKTCFK